MWLSLRQWLDRVWQRPDSDRVEEELEFHLALLERDLERRGLPAAAAKQEALRRFGDLKRLRAACAIADDADAAQVDEQPSWRWTLEQTSPSRALAVAVPIAVLSLTTYAQQILWRFAFYPDLYKHFAFYVPETLKNALEIGLCFLALFLVNRIGRRRAERELALSARPWPAFVFGLVCSSPMLIGFALTRSGERLSVLPILYFTVISPFTEELVSRGYAFRQLSLRAGWPFWAAALPVAVFTGLGHIEKGQTPAEVAGLFFLLGSGSFVFSWLIHRWESLWVPFALHFSMNLWWQLFNVSRTAIGGWLPFTLQSSSILLAILVTLRYRPFRQAGREAAPSAQPPATAAPRDGASRTALSLSGA